MTQTIEAVFDGKVFRTDEIIRLEPNTRVKIIVEVEPVAEIEPKSFLRTARDLNLEGPADFSARIDDYLYGKKDSDER